MIDVLVPVLGRPQNAQPLVDSIRANTTVPHTILFVSSLPDLEQMLACHDTGCPTLHMIFDAGPGDYAQKINTAFRETDSEFVFQAADDIEFTPGWDTQALRMMKPGIGVVATNDMANRQVMSGAYGTHNLIRRTYIEEHGGTFDRTPGVVLYEGYDHWFVDRELCDAARIQGAYTFAKRSVVRHRHPLWKTAEWDDTYRRGQARAKEDAALFLSRMPSRKRDIVSR